MCILCHECCRWSPCMLQIHYTQNVSHMCVAGILDQAVEVYDSDNPGRVMLPLLQQWTHFYCDKRQEHESHTCIHVPVYQCDHQHLQWEVYTHTNVNTSMPSNTAQPCCTVQAVSYLYQLQQGLLVLILNGKVLTQPGNTVILHRVTFLYIASPFIFVFQIPT